MFIVHSPLRSSPENKLNSFLFSFSFLQAKRIAPLQSLHGADGEVVPQVADRRTDQHQEEHSNLARFQPATVERDDVHFGVQHALHSRSAPAVRATLPTVTVDRESLQPRTAGSDHRNQRRRVAVQSYGAAQL